MRSRPLPAFAAIDFLSCLLVVFVAVALTSAPARVKTFGSYAVVITWPSGADDVDLYMRDPRAGVCFFGRPQVDQMQLEHDDLGTAATSYGRHDANQERIVLRSATPGQWIANVRLFARAKGSAPIPVTVTLWDLRSDDHPVYSDRRRLTHPGDELTAFRFTVDPAGNAGGISHVPVSLVSPTTNFTG